MAKASYSGVLKDIKNGKLSPCYFFHGEETFLAEEVTDAIIQKSFNATKDDFNLHIFYGKDAGATDILQAAMSFPMLAERKVVVLRDADQLKQASALEDYFKRPTDTTSFIAISAKPDMRKKPWNSMKDYATMVEFKPLAEAEIAAWMSEYLAKRKKQITEQALLLLSARLDTSLREINSQLDKLCTFVGDRPEINEEDVEAVVGISRQYNVFELCNAIGQKNLPLAVQIYQQMMRAGGEPVYMIVMLHRHFTILLGLRELKDAGQSPSAMSSIMMKEYKLFFQQSMFPQVQNYTVPQIHASFGALLEADTMIKSSGMKNDIIMTTLFFKLVRGHA